MIRLGRHRLLSDEQVNKSERLKTIKLRSSNPPEPDPTVEPFEAESSASAAVTARLLPVTLSPPEPGWRFSIPKNALGLVGSGPDNNDRLVYLLFSDGYLEVWSVEHLADAVQAPLDKVIP